MRDCEHYNALNFENSYRKYVRLQFQIQIDEKNPQQIDIQAMKIMIRFRQNMFTEQRKKGDTLISSYQ